MLISIDGIRYGAGYDAAGHWHEARADYVSPQEREKERAIMAPARGAIWGLTLSGVLWPSSPVGGVVSGCSSFASTMESSVVGRPLQSLFAPREFLLPAGALRSVVVEHGSGAEVAGLGVSVRVGVMGFSPANDRG